jgi:GntR family transcriptional regulator
MDYTGFMRGARTAPSLQPIPNTEAGPLYRQVKRELLRLLESGAYGPGQTLPNEATLARALRVSIGTLRKAVDELVHEHVLVRRQGKGTFVALHTDDRFLFQFFHIEPREETHYGDRLREREYPQVECVAFEKGRAEDAEATALEIAINEPVLRIDNRLLLSGTPVVHDRLVISARTFRGLTEDRFRDRPGTVYNLYQTDHGVTVLRAHERARAVPANLETARVLGVAPGTPVLQVHRVALTFGEKPVEYRVSTINTALHDYVSLLSKRS